MGLDLTWWLYPALFLAALVAGTMDTIAGGGGLITVPILMSLGWSPQVALGTNKLQASFGSGSATLHFSRAGAIGWRECLWGIGFTAIGASAGTLFVGSLATDLLRCIIPWLLAAIALIVLFAPRLGREEIRPRLGATSFCVLLGLCLGFYDGFFGPGTGSFWVLGYMLLRGQEMQRATVHTKVMNFTSNLVSLAFFAAMGCVVVIPGLVMATGQFVGGRLGARLVLAQGVRVIRPVFAVVALALAAKLFLDVYL